MSCEHAWNTFVTRRLAMSSASGSKSPIASGSMATHSSSVATCTKHRRGR